MYCGADYSIEQQELEVGGESCYDVEAIEL